MPSQKRSDHAKRYFTVVFLALLMIVPAFLLVTEVAEEGGATDAKETRAWLDIAVDGIEIVRTSQSNNVYPGQIVEIWVRLIHDDRPFISDRNIDSTNQFTTILVIDDGVDNVTTQYQTVGVGKRMTTNYTGQNPVGQGPNPPFVVKFFYEIPMRPPSGLTWTTANFRMTATITVDDDDKSDNSKSGSGLRVSEPEFSPVIWEEGQKDKETQGPVHEADVGDPLDIKFLLQNDGPAVDDIGIYILQAPEGWKVGGFEPITIYPNDEEELTLFVQIPNNPFLAQADGTYSIVVRAYSKFYAGPYPSDPSHTFRIKIGFKPGIKIVPRIPDGTNYLEPGMEHKVFFDVTNKGNGKDSYTMSGFLDEVHTKKGWKVSSPIPTLIQDLDPSKSREVMIRLTIPEDAAKFYHVNVILSGKSSKVPTYSREGEPLLVFASTRYAADIETPTLDGFWVEPGKENTVRFNFTNLGNDKDIDQFLEVDRKPLGWAVYIDQSPLKAQRGLGPRTTVMLEMTVFVTETALTTEWVSRPRVVIKAYGGPFTHELDSETFEFNIPPRFKVDLSSPEPEKEGFIGGQVKFVVNVRNAGNWEDTFNLSVESKTLDVKLDRVSVFVFPDDIYTVELTVKIPQDAAADTNPDTPYPNDPAKNWYDGYSFKVFAYSTNETTKGGTLKELVLKLHVQPFYDFIMEVDPEEKPLRFSSDHDQNRAVKVRLTNMGNIADLIRLDWDDNPYSWLRLQNTYIDIPDNEIAYAVVNINPMKGDIDIPGTINVTLNGYSKNDPDGTLARSLDMEITFYQMLFEYSEPKMNGEEMPPTIQGRLGHTYSFQIDVENIGSTEFHPTYYDTLYVILFDGPFEVDRANITWLEEGADEQVIFKHTFSTPGPHVMTFRLESDTPISEESEVVIQKTVIVPPPPPPPPVVNNDPPVWAVLIPILLLIIFITLIVVFVVKYNQIYISPIDTGYDEDGEYKPWAVKEKMKEDDKKELEAPPEREALPEPSKPGLPPGPTPAQAAPLNPARPGMPRQAPTGAPTPVAQPVPGRPMPAGARPPMPPQGARPPMQPPRPGQ